MYFDAAGVYIILLPKIQRSSDFVVFLFADLKFLKNGENQCPQ